MHNVCAICLESAQARGGVPLFSPGCCGKWFHQPCIDGMIAAGNKNCPECRAPIPIVAAPTPAVPAIANPPAAPPVPPAPSPAQQSTNRTSFFGFLRSSRNTPASATPITPSVLTKPESVSFPEDLVDSLEPVAEEEEEGVDSEASTAPVVTVTATPEFETIGLSARDPLYAQLNIKYEENVALAKKKVPVDITCILDNSGSMGGAKIASLRTAMKFVVDSLGPRDRLAVVNFNSTAQVKHALLKMSSDNKQKSKALIDGIGANGGTDILSGMKLGWDIMRTRRTHNPTSCIFLLTDGQDRGNTPEKLELARTIKSSGASLFVFGFGNDHDSAHMNAISDAGEGSFTFIESDDMAADAFGGAIGTQQGISLSQIRLRVDTVLPRTEEGASNPHEKGSPDAAAAAMDVVMTPRDLDDQGVRIRRVIAGNYSYNLSADGTHVIVEFLNMFMGESRDILVELSVPPVAAPVDPFRLLRARATYHVVQVNETLEGSPQLEAAPVDCTVKRVTDEEEKTLSLTRHTSVDLQLQRNQCTAAITAALAAADQSNLGIARDGLQAARTQLVGSVSYLAENPVALALLVDIDDALNRVQTLEAYRAGGRSMMAEAASGHTYQRSCYTKASKMNSYQTSVSSGYQEQAKISKTMFKKG